MSEYFSTLGVIVYIFVVFVFSALAYGIISDQHSGVDEKNRIKYSYISVLIIVVITGLISIQLSNSVNERQKNEVVAEQVWRAQGCPVYKTQCGSKHPYACERKAAIIGRNRVGDIFVEAYGTCSK